MIAADSLDVQSWVGLAASTAYTRLLLSEPCVQRVSVFKYSSPPSLQQRMQMTEAEQSLVEHALLLRATTYLPFWNAMFASCLLHQTHSAELVASAFFHNGPGESADYERRDLEDGALDQLSGEGASNIGLSSAVRDADGQLWHLGLLDFRCDISPHNERLVALVCSHIMPRGYLLIDSGDSYHACGVGLLTAEERIYTLGRALLAAPVVDSHYIAHQLQQQASSIRISPGGKALRRPYVVRAWLPQAGASRNGPPL